MAADPHKALDQALTYISFLRYLAQQAQDLEAVPTREAVLRLRATAIQTQRYIDLQENILLEGLVGSFSTNRHVTARASSLRIPELARAILLLEESKERCRRSDIPSREGT